MVVVVAKALPPLSVGVLVVSVLASMPAMLPNENTNTKEEGGEIFSWVRCYSVILVLHVPVCAPQLPVATRIG